MLGAGNFTGVPDQLGFLAGMPGSGYDNPRTADDAEECGWLLAEALAGLGDARCADVAADFLRRFPSSPFASAWRRQLPMRSSSTMNGPTLSSLTNA